MADVIVFSPERRAELVKFRRAGLSWDDIGRRMGVSRARAHVEGVSLGLASPLVRGVPAAKPVPRDCGAGEGLRAWHPISRGVLADAGLPVPREGEVW